MAKKIKLRALLIFLLCFVATERFCRWQTEGFTVAKISSTLIPDPRYDTPPPSSEILATLDQPFHFLGSGAQFYAFESADGKTVVKFLKHSRRRPHTWLNDIHLLGPLETWRQNIIAARSKRIAELLESCRIASQVLQKETAILYAHLNKTNFLHKHLTIVDKIGIEHIVDLDQIEFLLQKKAIPVASYLKKHPESGCTALESIATLTKIHAEKKVALLDKHIERNCGILDGQAIDIDVGSFKFYDEKLQKAT